MISLKLRSWFRGVLCASLTLVSSSAFAWPDRPIELIVGFAAGGGTDLTARTLATYLEKELGGPVVVVNKAGASGALGLAYVARAKPDGYTLGVTNMPGLLTLPIEREAGFNFESFTYLGTLVRDPSAFSVSAESPYQNLKELIDDARKQPGLLSYASTGVGTDDHLAMVLFNSDTGVELNHVPFNGAAPMRNAVLGGHATIGGMNLGEAMPYQGTKLRILGQASEKRSPLAPDVPTFIEQGVNLVFASERGVVAPKDLPAEVQVKISDALEKIAADPKFQDAMHKQFTEMDYLRGDAWKVRLKKADDHFRALWAKQQWID
jgi:tripartite-type tricarboxylate transporter receptor subunit TctC